MKLPPVRAVNVLSVTAPPVGTPLLYKLNGDDPYELGVDDVVAYTLK